MSTTQTISSDSWCIDGCECNCNQVLCGCRDIAAIDRRIAETAAELDNLNRNESE